MLAVAAVPDAHGIPAEEAENASKSGTKQQAAHAMKVASRDPLGQQRPICCVHIREV